MEKMDMDARNKYLGVLRKRYFAASRKREKTQILDEYCRNTGQNRKYVIRKINSGTSIETKRTRKPRKAKYDGEVKAVLAQMWEVFDHPCGQRLKPALEQELERLRGFGEIKCSDETAVKLQQISSATIDRKLKREREVTHWLNTRGRAKPSTHLKRKIAIRLTEWDTSEVGNVEVDLVLHCGSSTAGEFLNTVSVTEIYSGWWDGVAIMGKSQDATFPALKEIRGRSPFDWKAMDSDNGSEFINDVLYKYCCREKIEFTRSRPGKKNDNAYIEEKNWTHVRKVMGYLRYDTPMEQRIINDLYQHESRLYKNFFQPVMKLVSKERIGGKVKRKYDKPKTPYQRLIESGQISEDIRLQLEATHLSLNPAELKRSIDAKLNNLLKAYQSKNNGAKPDPNKRQVPRTVTSLMIQPELVGLPV